MFALYVNSQSGSVTAVEGSWVNMLLIYFLIVYQPACSSCILFTLTINVDRRQTNYYTRINMTGKLCLFSKQPEDCIVLYTMHMIIEPLNWYIWTKNVHHKHALYST